MSILPGVFFMLVPLLSFGAPKNLDSTSPKFDCTVVEILENEIARDILGSHGIKSMRLRKTPSKWIFFRNGKHLELEIESVTEDYNPVAQKTSYRIHEKQLQLEFELFGNPPSRQGMLWEIKNPPEISKKIARITCH